MRVLLALGLAVGIASAGTAEGKAALESGDFKTALDELSAAGEAGDAEAQFLTGEIFRRGLGLRANPRLAAKWYERAEAQGHGGATGELGILDWNANRKDDAVRRLRKGAEAGHVRAMYFLAVLDYRGAGIGLRDDERRDLFRRAAEGGHPDAQDTYAGMVKKEHPEEALAWYRKAAEQGHPHAYAGIGGCLMDQVKTEGGGTNITALRQALDAYKKAALLGDYQAQHFLALAHLARGTYDEAYAWAKIGSTSRNSWPAHGPIIEKLYKDLAKSLKDVLKKCRGYTSPEQEREGKRLAKEYEKEIRANLKKGLPWEEPED